MTADSPKHRALLNWWRVEVGQVEQLCLACDHLITDVNNVAETPYADDAAEAYRTATAHLREARAALTRASHALWNRVKDDR